MDLIIWEQSYKKCTYSLIQCFKNLVQDEKIFVQYNSMLYYEWKRQFLMKMQAS